jgi:hypothetical protein
MGTRNGRQRIGELLLGEGVLSAPSLERALAAQQRTRSEVRLGSALLGIGVITEDTLLGALARAHGCPTVGADELENADPAAVKRLPSARAYRLNAMPYAIDKKTIRVAFADPSNIAAIDEVAAVTGCRVIPAVASEVRLMDAHRKHYGRVLSRHFVSILKRLAMPPEAAAPARPQVVVPPPPPRFLDFSAPPTDVELQAEMPSLATTPVDEAATSSPGEVVTASPDAAAAFIQDQETTQPQEASAVEDAGIPEPAPTEAEAGTSPSAADRFSDEYSLTEFLAEALEGVSIEDLWHAGGFDEDFPLDLGEPISDGEDPEKTRPSRRSNGARSHERGAGGDDARMDASA